MTLNDSSTEREKLQITIAALRAAPDIWESLAAAGAKPVRITGGHDYPMEIQVVNDRGLLAWVLTNGYEPKIEEWGHGDGAYPWTVSVTPCDNLMVYSILTNEEKEAWEHEMDTRDPA